MYIVENLVFKIWLVSPVLLVLFFGDSGNNTSEIMAIRLYQWPILTDSSALTIEKGFCWFALPFSEVDSRF